jgi:hypothetical protein
MYILVVYANPLKHNFTIMYEYDFVRRKVLSYISVCP